MAGKHNGTHEMHHNNNNAENAGASAAREKQAKLLESLAAQLTEAARLLRGDDDDDDKCKRDNNTSLAYGKVTKVTLELLAKTRKPPEILMDWFQTMGMVSAVHLFQEWKVFDVLPRDGHAMTYAELASRIDAQESLVVRVALMLTSMGVLKQVGLDSVAHTPMSLMLRDEEPTGSMFKVMFINICETAPILPSYFATYGRKEPDRLNHIPTSFLAGQPELSYFEFLHQDKDRMKNFMRAMSISHRGAPVVGLYDLTWLVEKVKDQDQDQTRPLFVDFGGGKGHTLQLFRRAFPGLPADRCVVQDLPEVVEEASRNVRDAPADDEDMNLLRGVQWVGFDFHRDAPVPGAAAYYMRHVPSDYSDPVAAALLRRVREAMAPDSRVLIAELLLVRDKPSAHAALKDFCMLPIGGKQRTLEDWGRVAGQAGLKITGVFRDASLQYAVIECMREDSG